MNIRRESGLTFIGFLIVLVMILFFIYAGMRVVPMYLEYHALGNALKTLQDNPKAKSMSPQQLKQKIGTSLWASYANNNIKPKHMHISKKSDGINIRVAYEVRKPFLGNIDIIGSFEKSIVLSK